MKETIDFLIPAHNEEATVSAVSSACLHAAEELNSLCTVTVIADHCSDRTKELAESTGANVLERTGSSPSKAGAIQVGIGSTEGSVVALFDADCIGIRADHIKQLVRPVVGSEVALSVGVIDYGRIFTPLVQRFPWSSGQRVLRRDSFDWQDARMSGYMIEMIINESIGLSGGIVSSSVLDGVRHNSKLHKTSVVHGLYSNFRMWKSIAGRMREIDKDGLSTYFKAIRLRDASDTTRQPVISNIIGGLVLKASRQPFRRDR